MTLAERVRKAREYARLTQAELADRVNRLFGENITQQTISKLEAGAETSAYVAQIAAACGVSAVWLSSEIQPMAPEGTSAAAVAEATAHYRRGPVDENRLTEVITTIEEMMPPCQFPIAARKRAGVISAIYNLVRPDGTLPMAEVVTLIRSVKTKYEEEHRARKHKGRS